MTKQEMEQGFQRVWEMFLETRREFQDIAARFKDTNDQIQATNRQLSQTDKKIEALTGKWGRFVEGLVLPAAERLFQERGIMIDGVSPRNKRRYNGATLEIDVLAVGAEYVVLIEVKSTLSLDDVKEHIRDLGRFRTFFPEYAGRKVLGAVASIVLEEQISRYAYQQGLFVIGQSGDAVCLLNDDNFRPKEW